MPMPKQKKISEKLKWKSMLSRKPVKLALKPKNIKKTQLIKIQEIDSRQYWHEKYTRAVAKSETQFRRLEANPRWWPSKTHKKYLQKFFWVQGEQVRCAIIAHRLPNKHLSGMSAVERSAFCVSDF